MMLTSFRLRLAIAIALAAFQTACTPSHYVTEQKPDYNPTTSARMRILTGNDQQKAAFRPGACATKGWQTDPVRIDVDDGFFARYKYSSRSVTIGMTPSPRPWMHVEGLHFKDLIREYVVEAGKPVALSMSAAGGTDYAPWSCSASNSAFTPAAGQDYDVYLALKREGRNSYSCDIAVRHIDASGLDEPVETVYAPACPGADDEPTTRGALNR